MIKILPNKVIFGAYQPKAVVGRTKGLQEGNLLAKVSYFFGNIHYKKFKICFSGSWVLTLDQQLKLGFKLISMIETKVLKNLKASTL